jgi:hypothetical protein
MFWLFLEAGVALALLSFLAWRTTPTGRSREKKDGEPRQGARPA